MRKVRVLFPYVEAGLGHIMPMRAVEEIFTKKYGDKVEVIHTNFYTDTNNKYLLRFHNFLISEVKKYENNSNVGYFATKSCEVFGTKASTFGTMVLSIPGSKRAGIKYMKELNPDLVFSTHWATHYYARQLKSKPITVNYCPDAIMNKMFQYPADLTLISMPCGYEEGKKNSQYNEDNFKLVPFLIRNQAFEISLDKKVNRKNLGFPEDKFTIVLAEGGYGLGRMKEICELLVKEHLPITVVPVCGKNDELYSYLKSLECTSEVTFIPFAYTERILEMIASADLFLGKSGNIIAEPTFFGVPSIITNFSTMIEENIGNHYINYVGSAMKEFDSHKVIEMIRDFVNDPSKLEPYKKAAIANHKNYGAEVTADLMWDLLVKKYPELEK